MNRPGVRGCPSYGQPSLSGCSSCLPFASSFHIILLPGGLFYRPDLLRIEPGDCAVWTNDPDVWWAESIIQATWTTVLVVLNFWATSLVVQAVWTTYLVFLAAWTTEWF